MTSGLANTPAERCTPAIVQPFLLPALRLGVLGAALLAVSAAHGATLGLYDDFSTSTVIGPSRWEGDDRSQYGATRVEEVRSILNGAMHLELKAYSDQYGNSGTASARNSVVLVKSTAVTDLRATVTITAATEQPCAANTTSPSRAAARLFGFFFNAGLPAPGSEYNDVYAGAQVYRLSNSTESGTTFHVSAFLGICDDDSCINSSTLASQDMGTVLMGTPTTLTISWDKANKRFTFTRDALTPINLTYSMSDVTPPTYGAKRLEIANNISECKA